MQQTEERHVKAAMQNELRSLGLVLDDPETDWTVARTIVANLTQAATAMELGKHDEGLLAMAGKEAV